MAAASIAGLIACSSAANSATGAEQVIAQSGAKGLTRGALDHQIAFYEWQLESPLNATQRRALDAISIERFKSEPDVVLKNLTILGQVLASSQSMPPIKAAAQRQTLWGNVLEAARTDEHTAAALAILEKHQAVVVTTASVVITQAQIDALFASNDVVADLARMPKSSRSEREQFRSQVASEFSQWSEDKQTQLILAEPRWVMVRDFIIACSDKRAAAVNEVHEKVHDRKDIPDEARNLEDWGFKFAAVIQRHTDEQRQLAQLTYQHESQMAALRAATPDLSRPGDPRGSIRQQDRAFEAQNAQSAALLKLHLSSIYAGLMSNGAVVATTACKRGPASGRPGPS